MRTRAQGSEARAYPGFLSVEACLGVLLLSPERYASPSQGSPLRPQQYDAGTRRRESKWSKRLCLRKQGKGRGLNPRSPNPEFEVLTARPHTPPHF